MMGYSHSLTASGLKALVREIKKRECLWNTEHEDYSDRYKILVAWKEVSEQMDIPVEILRQKWKNLRDTFKREEKKCGRKLTKLSDYTGKWKNFRLLWFIKGIKDNAPPEDENEDSDDAEESGEYMESREYLTVKDVYVRNKDSTESDGDNSCTVKVEPPDKNGDEFIFTEVLEEDPLPTKKRKKSSTEDDYDLMFLQSLTPYLRKLEPMRKLVVRNKMQDMLMNELAAQNMSGNNNNKKW